MKMKRTALFAAALAMAALATPAAWATTYTIDTKHSSVTFKIRHLFSKVEGAFTDYQGMYDYVPGHPEQWNASATVQAASIDTRAPDRDKHLRSKDFFEVDAYPTIQFQGTGVSDVTESGAKLAGVLTLHGVQKPIVLDVQILGEGKDPWGNIRSGFTATTKINRKDFGLTWNKALESGQLLVGDEVDIVIEVEGVAKALTPSGAAPAAKLQSAGATQPVAR